MESESDHLVSLRAELLAKVRFRLGSKDGTACLVFSHLNATGRARQQT